MAPGALCGRATRGQCRIPGKSQAYSHPILPPEPMLQLLATRAVGSRSSRPAHPLLDHLIRPRQERRWDGQPECLGGLEVDDEREFIRLLDDESRRHDPMLSPALDDREPIDARQHAVNCHHDIVATPTKSHPFVAVRGQIDLIAARSQAIDHLLCRVRVVLDDEDTLRVAVHGSSSPTVLKIKYPNQLGRDE